jgi:hypothetical protein
MTDMSDLRPSEMEATSAERTFDDVMIDIETLSLHKHKALVLSVGLVEFDPKPLDRPTFGKQLAIYPNFYDQILLPRRVDLGTQEFWKKQSKEAIDNWLHPPGYVSLPVVCTLVREFCKGKSRVWANGNQFDLANLEGLADDIGEAALWHYQAPRDMRTFCRETSVERLVPIGDAMDIPGVAHEPIYDCTVQAWQVWSHYRDH